MEDQNKTNSFKKLFDKLQEDSWQLELLISAFAIFGLFSALEPLALKMQAAHYDKNQSFLIFFIIASFSVKILIFNLLVHVTFRGLWIGSLGLRSVFGEIDFEKLNYGEKFTKYLKRNIGSFDSYIQRLENFCSVIFAISFLLIFYIFAFFLINFLILGFYTPIPAWLVIFVRIVFIFFALGIILTFIDFITLGFLKKKKWLAKIYFPFYRVFSLLTLSFLYRPLVYNLLDNKLGRRLSLGLIPFYIMIYVGFNLYYQKSNFITAESVLISSEFAAYGRNYEDVIGDKDRLFILDFAIQSKVITDPFIKIIIPLNSKIEDDLIEFNPSLKTEKDQRGLHFRSEVSYSINGEKQNGLNEEYFRTFQKKYSFKIDSSTYNPDFVITNIKGDLGFESYIGIKGLATGKHMIEFQALKNNGSDSVLNIRKIPFWYYGD